MVSCKKKLNGILYFVVFPGSPKLDGGPQISLVQLYALIRTDSKCSGLGLHLLRVMARLRAKKIYIYSETLYFTFSFFCFASSYFCSFRCCFDLSVFVSGVPMQNQHKQRLCFP